MKRFRSVALLSVLTIVFLLTSIINVSAYPFALSLWDGSNEVVVQDGQAGLDANPVTGAITYIGEVGSCTVNVSTALTMPVLGSITQPQLDLNSVSAGTGTLTIGATSYDFAAPFPVGLVMEVGGTAWGTAQFSGYYDDISDQFYTGYGAVVESPVFTAGSFSGTYYGLATNVNGESYPNLVGLTLYAQIVNETFGVTSFDVNYRSVPEPTTMLLLGLGLIGLTGLRKK